MKPFLKTPLLIVSLLFVSNLFFSSCHKDKNDPETASIPLIASASTFTDEGVLDFSQFYQYDQQGRLTKMTENDGYYSTVEYSGSTIILNSYDEDGLYDTSTAQLNNQGLCTSMVSEEGDAEETYEYYSNGYRKSTSYEADTWKLTSTFTVLEGNYVTIISEETSNDTNAAIVKKFGALKSSFLPTNLGKGLAPKNRLKSTASVYYSKTDCQFYTDKINTIEYENMGLSFLGKQSKNPIKQEIITFSFDSGSPDTQTINYTYVYDAKGRIIKQTTDDGYYSVYTYVD